MDNLNMNVNDYSNSDLLKIIGLDSNYDTSPYLINTKIDALIEQMKQEGKTKFITFFEKIRLKLLINKNLDDDEENDEESNQEDDEEDEEEDEDEEDEEEENDETEETKDVKIFLNRDNTKNATQVFNIDTRFRSDYYNSLSTSFTIDLPEVQKNVVSMRLASIEMPITYYSLSNTLGNNNMLILSNDLS